MRYCRVVCAQVEAPCVIEVITEMLHAGAPGDPPRQPLELWVAETSTGEARCLLKSPQMGINATFDECAPLLGYHMP